MKNQIFALLIAGIVAGCSSLDVTGSAVTTGEAHQPVPQEQVKIYVGAPEKSVILGTVQVVASESANENIKTMELVLPELTKQAAAIGANGVVLKTNSVNPDTGSETYVADAILVSK
jgi:hypothetical protein